MTTDRRRFLRHVAAGSAVVCMPAFLHGCGALPAAHTAAELPGNPFLDWFAIDEQVLARLMSELTANGADAAEIYFQHARRNEMMLDDGGHGTEVSEILQGVGMRVIRGEQTGFASTEDLTPASMLAAARRAAAVMDGAPAGARPAWAYREPGDLYLTSEAWSDVAASRKRPILERVDQQARGADPAVGNVTVTWSDIDERVLIATLEGRIVTDRRPLTRLSAQVTATSGGETCTGFASLSARDGPAWYTFRRVDELARDAVERTLIQFEARQPPAGEMPVILAAGASGVLLHEAVGHALEADFNLSGASPYADKLGTRIAAGDVTIVDQATLAHERGAMNHDDEGTPGGRTVLVEDGRLRSYLHDWRTARRYGVESTGSARRESYRYPPMPRMTCTFMENGPYAPEALLEGVRRGIIAETYTGGQVGIGAGDYAFSIKNGWLVENGRRTMPIRDLRILGNGPETLGRVSMVANDGRLAPGGWTCGKYGQRVPVSHGMPTVLVSTLTVDADPAAAKL